MRIIHEQGDYRIIEEQDEYVELDNLKGDCFDPKYNSDIAPSELAAQEKQFEDLVEREGVFGYVLEKWNPAVGHGWEHVDSCWGFVGQYTPAEATFNHYVVDELKAQYKG